MKMKTFIYLIFVFLLSCSALQENKRACKEVEEKLVFVESYLKGKPDKQLKIIKVISYLEKLTGIESEADGSEIGKFNPTQRDYIKWKEWYINNKKRLYYDNGTNSVIVKKGLE